MFKLINQTHEKEILYLVKKIEIHDMREIADSLFNIITSIYSDIPENKKISYGRYSISKNVGLLIYPLLKEKNIEIIKLSTQIFNDINNDQFVRSLCTQLLSLYGEETGKLHKVLPVFEKAALDDNWILREGAAGYIRKLIKKYPDEMHKWYTMMVTSLDPLIRRFAAESLRPVADNQWIKKNPDFAFSIIEHLFKESNSYPRTSAGNNLSDWMRIDKERTLKIVKKLHRKKGNDNNHHLVKKEPLLVMDILKTDQYVYKDRKFFREDLK